ncbi:mis18-binding protein 1 [Thamnophis elegans]|uniref:mis18-binding protein 1 n=1 Tax=Thamnophis elegans TaxID=35005 RepID=UPI001376BEE3|nr:mis18-binding protein 1 [Thamnophis elegans]
MSLKAVSLHSIPGGTPLKDFVKFQGNCTLKSAKIPPSMVLSCHNGQETKGIEVFQSTLISSNTHIQEFFDISEIKASEGMLGRISSCQKTKHMSRSAVQKRKACEPLSHESPAKIFSRMKQKAALVKEKNKPPEAKLLDTKHTADYILTPERQPAFLPSSEKIPIVEDKQKTKVDEDFLEESNVKTVSVTDFTAVNKTTCTTVISPVLLESPNKFFSRVKQRLQKDWLPKAKQPLITPRPAKQLNNLNEEYVSTTVSQKEKNIVESAELASETFTIISNPVIVSDDHVKSKEFLKKRAFGILLQDKAVVTPSKYICDQKAGENLSVSPQKPSQHLCDTIFATPKAHIPRKRQPATKGLLEEPDTGTNEKFSKKKDVIYLNEWGIRVINDNTAVCLEGIRRDMDNIFWHSNVIVERIARNQVKTLTGNIYMLEGPIDAVNMKKGGIPPAFIKKFGRGIPINWKRLVDDLLRYMKRKEERAFPVSGDSEEINECTEELDLPQNIEKKYITRNTTYDVLPLQNDTIYDMQMKTTDLQNDSERSFTRSGRLIKPPMQYWCGERIHLDQALNITINKGGANYLTPSMSSMPPVKRRTNKRPKKNGEIPFKDHKEVPLNQAKGKINMKSKNITRKTKCKLERQSQHLISDPEENDTEFIIKDIHKKEATVMLTPLRKKIMQEKQHSNSRPRNEQNVTKDCGNITCCEINLVDVESDTLNCTLNLLKQHQQIEKVVENVPCTDEDESNEEIPCIKRKIRPPFKREMFNKECNNTQGPSHEQKSTENCVAPSQSQKTKCSYIVQEDSLEVLSNKSSSPDLDTSSKLEKRNRQKSQKGFKRARKNALASDTESENSIEAFPVEESKITIPTKRTNGRISTSPKALPVARKPLKQSKLRNAVKSLPDTDENWTEEEVEKMYRAVASFPKYKSGFWMAVAKSVGTRSAEECQEKYMADHDGKKCVRKKTTKPGKKEERDRGTQQQPLAKVGTLKRIQQMRKFLEEMPKDNHDDIFTSTPFQNRNIKLPQFCVAPEEDIFQLKESQPITPASAIFPWLKTPQCDHLTPGMLEPPDRESCDRHVFHMQKLIKGKERTWLNVKKKSAVTVLTTPMSRRTNVFNFEDVGTSTGVRNLFEVEEEMQSDEENDVYFST